MSTAAENPYIPYSYVEQLREARAIIRHEADALSELSRRLDAQFCRAAELILHCEGTVILSGMGKAGLIGQKIAATLSSLGSPAHFLHPAEAVHGDLGCVRARDVLLALSNSGETEELLQLIPIVRRLGAPVIAVTASESSSLGSQADVTIPLGRLREAGPWGLAPSTSTTAMLALGDALALVVSRLRGFTPQQFAVFHPGGSLGRQLQTVGDVMRPISELRIATDASTIREVFVRHSRPGRRAGAVILTDAGGRLSGLFTDSDLARLLEQHRDFQFDRAISEVMTWDPLTIGPTVPLGDVVDLLAERKVSELPVVDDEGRPVGMIDITDVIGLFPGDAPS